MQYKINKMVKQFATRLFEVVKVNLTLPDGSLRDYDLLNIQNAVTILPIDDDGYVYFVRQFRVGSQKELLELPAGKVEEGENPLETARREVREETGMAAREMIPLGNFYMSPGYSSEYMYTYLARGLHPGPLTADADEFINLIKVPLPEASRMILDREIEDSKTLAVFMLAQKELQSFNKV